MDVDLEQKFGVLHLRWGKWLGRIGSHGVWPSHLLGSLVCCGPVDVYMQSCFPTTPGSAPSQPRSECQSTRRPPQPQGKHEPLGHPRRQATGQRDQQENGENRKAIPKYKSPSTGRGKKKKYSWVIIIQKHVEPHEEPKTYRGK